MGTPPSKEKEYVKLKLESDYTQIRDIFTSTNGCDWGDYCKVRMENDSSYTLYYPERKWIMIQNCGPSSEFYFPGTDLIELGKVKRGSTTRAQATLDRSVTPWVFTYYNHRRSIKIINRSQHNVTVTRTKGDPLVVSPGSATKTDNLDDIMTHDGICLHLINLVRTKDGDITLKTAYHTSGLTFDCTDHTSGLVTVVVREGTGG